MTPAKAVAASIRITMAIVTPEPTPRQMEAHI
jgi:hypothetical protein